MEANTILIIDEESNKVKLFGKIYKEIDFCDIDILPHILKGEIVLFLKEAEELDINDLESLSSLKQDNENRYVISVSEKPVQIQDLNLIFYGRKDPKKLDLKWFKKCKMFVDLYKSGTLKIISEKEYKNIKKNILNKDSNSIILTKSVDKFLDENDNIFDNDDKTLDISEDETIETEAEQIIKSIKRK